MDDSVNICTRPIEILGLGARTVFGITYKPSVAAIRAGIRGFKQHPYLIDKSGYNVIVAADRLLDIDTVLQSRLVEMAKTAIMEAITPVLQKSNKPTVALIVGLPTDRGETNALDYQYIGELLVTALEKDIQLTEIQLIHHGHAAGIEAIYLAQNILHKGAADYCVAGGVDSYLDANVIERIDQQGRLSARNYGWGFVPGEAASFGLFSKADQHRGIAQVLSTAIAVEENLINTDAVCTGVGLTAAVRGALGVVDPEHEKVKGIYCDLNGERYRSDEFGFTIMRTQQWFENPGNFNSPAQAIGDVGAAVGMLNLAMASEGTQENNMDDSLSMLCSSSDSGKRAALVLRTSNNGERSSWQ